MDRAPIQARYVVGADGPRSIVARAAGVQAATRLPARIGLTYHLDDPHPSAVRDARMRVLDDGYVGIAPVAGGRVNVGIVLGRAWTRPARDRRRAIRRGLDRGDHRRRSRAMTSRGRAGRPSTRSPEPGRSEIA